jgi:hypothetical protein
MQAGESGVKRRRSIASGATVEASTPRKAVIVQHNAVDTAQNHTPVRNLSNRYSSGMSKKKKIHLTHMRIKRHARSEEVQRPVDEEPSSPAKYVKQHGTDIFKEVLATARSKGQSVTQQDSTVFLMLLWVAVTVVTWFTSDGTVGTWFTKCVELVCSISGLSHVIFYDKIWPTFYAAKEFYDTDNRYRGCASSQHPQFRKYEDAKEKLLKPIRTCIDFFHESGRAVTIKKLVAFANWYLDRSDQLPTPGQPTGHAKVVVTRHFIRRFLEETGMEYKQIKRNVEHILSSPARSAAFRRFALMYDYAWKQYMSGGALILALDESYCHQNHHAKKGWVYTNKPVAYLPASRGKRMIIIHAMCPDGMCVPEQGVTFHDDIQVDFPSCEWLWEHCTTVKFQTADGKTEEDPVYKIVEDYHVTVNAVLFYLWFLHRVIPWIKANNKDGKKVYVLLDNAAYHHARASDDTNPMQFTTKAKIVAAIRKKYLAHKDTMPALPHFFRVKRDNVFLLKDFLADDVLDLQGVNTMSLEEMKVAALLWIQQYFPQTLSSQLEQLCAQHNICLIFTPPYATRSQPIEHMWGIAKGYVADCFAKGMKLNDVQALFRRGLYGSMTRAGQPDVSYRFKQDSKRLVHVFEHAIQQTNEQYLPYAKLSDQDPEHGIGKLVLNSQELAEQQYYISNPELSRRQLREQKGAAAETDEADVAALMDEDIDLNAVEENDDDIDLMDEYIDKMLKDMEDELDAAPLPMYDSENSKLFVSDGNGHMTAAQLSMPKLDKD